MHCLVTLVHNLYTVVELHINFVLIHFESQPIAISIIEIKNQMFYNFDNKHIMSLVYKQFKTITTDF